MVNLNFFKSVASVFSAIGTVASVVERNANTLDNFSKLGENYSANLVAEQEILNAQRIKDMQAKMDKKYEQEKSQWAI